MIPLDLATWAETAVGGSMVAGPAGRPAGRAGVVLLALRGAAAARLPLLRDRAGCRRGRRGYSTPRGRMLAGASLFVLGFAVVFVITGVVAGSAGRAAGRVPRHDHPGARAWWSSCWA